MLPELRDETGGLDEVVLRSIRNRFESHQALQKEREQIVERLKQQGAASPNAILAIEEAQTLPALEAIEEHFSPSIKSKNGAPTFASRYQACLNSVCGEILSRRSKLIALLKRHLSDLAAVAKPTSQPAKRIPLPPPSTSAPSLLRPEIPHHGAAPPSTLLDESAVSAPRSHDRDRSRSKSGRHSQASSENRRWRRWVRRGCMEVLRVSPQDVLMLHRAEQKGEIRLKLGLRFSHRTGASRSCGTTGGKEEKDSNEELLGMNVVSLKTEQASEAAYEKTKVMAVASLLESDGAGSDGGHIGGAEVGKEHDGAQDRHGNHAAAAVVVEDAFRENVIRKACSDAVKRSIEEGPAAAAIRSEVWKDVLMRSRERALDVFRANLKSVFLARPLRGNRVLGVDPGYRSGCKMAAVDARGRLLLMRGAGSHGDGFGGGQKGGGLARLFYIPRDIGRDDIKNTAAYKALMTVVTLLMTMLMRMMMCQCDDEGVVSELLCNVRNNTGD
eukprot:jgi/Bigna1/134191/aug1.24_g8899